MQNDSVDLCLTSGTCPMGCGPSVLCASRPGQTVSVVAPVAAPRTHFGGTLRHHGDLIVIRHYRLVAPENRGLDAKSFDCGPREMHIARDVKWRSGQPTPRRLGVKRPSLRVSDPFCYLVLLLCSSENLGSGVSGGRFGLTTSLNQASC
jgi:hypothetical protein